VAVHVYNLWLLLFLFILFKFNFHVTVLFGAVFFVVMVVLQRLVVALVGRNLTHRFKILLFSGVVLRGSQELVWLLGNIFFFLAVTIYCFVDLINSFRVFLLHGLRLYLIRIQ
jgi:uncharacterized membrane protein